LAVYALCHGQNLAIYSNDRHDRNFAYDALGNVTQICLICFAGDSKQTNHQVHHSTNVP
jgi:hypothetical protein